MEIDFTKVKLGSILGEGLKDTRTLHLDKVVNSDIQAPVSWDFDSGRKPFVSHMWGNDDYGDCECAGRANYLLRLQRLQTKTTPNITDDDVIALYKMITGCQEAGDNNDTGMSTITNLSQWRQGWNITKDWEKDKSSDRDFEIAAYGYIDPSQGQFIRLCAFLFSGVLLGANMPLTAQAQTPSGVWDVDPSAGADAEPGSWGGHCIYAKRYDADNIYVITWGQQIRVTNAWFDKYVSEAYSVIDSLDAWQKHPQILDVDNLIAEMKSLGIQVQS